MNTKTVKILIAILAIFLITTISTAIYNTVVNKYETETAIMYSVSDRINFNGVYVRDEKPIAYTGNGVVRYNIADGGKVAKNSVIAQIYSSEQAIETEQKLDELNRQLELLKKIQNPGTTEVAQPTFLANLIAEHYKSIAYNKEFGNMQQVRSDEEELLVLLSIMQIVTGESDSFQAKISAIETEISSLKAESEELIDTIYSDEPAYFVSKVDGYESTLSKANIDNLTINDIENIKDDISVDSGNIGKFIYGYNWSLVGIIDNSQKTFAEGDKVNVNFESTSTQVSATVSKIKDSDDAQKSIIIFSCSKLTSDLVQHRVEKVEIVKKEYKGIKVPRSAIRFQDEILEDIVDIDSSEALEETTTAVSNDLENSEISPDAEDSTEKIERTRGVYVRLGEKIIFRKIDVIYEGDDYVISNIKESNSEYLMLYDDIITEGVE